MLEYIILGAILIPCLPKIIKDCTKSYYEGKEEVEKKRGNGGGTL